MSARRKRPVAPSAPETFSSFFEKVGEQTWRIRGSGVSGAPTESARVARVVDALRGIGLDVRESCIMGMCAADMYTLDAKFPGGELSAQTGNYFGQSKGAWLEGRDAVRLVAGLLGLRLTPSVASRNSLPDEPDLAALRQAAAKQAAPPS